jgi:hypothetical protein
MAKKLRDNNKNRNDNIYKSGGGFLVKHCDCRSGCGVVEVESGRRWLCRWCNKAFGRPRNQRRHQGGCAERPGGDRGPSPQGPTYSTRQCAADNTRYVVLVEPISPPEAFAPSDITTSPIRPGNREETAEVERLPPQDDFTDFVEEFWGLQNGLGDLIHSDWTQDQSQGLQLHTPPRVSTGESVEAVDIRRCGYLEAAFDAVDCDQVTYFANLDATFQELMNKPTA